MGVVLTLVDPAISEETVQFFKSLAAAAERGEIVGAAVVYIKPGGFPWRFALDISGCAWRDPTFVRGTLNQFDKVLADLPANKA